MINLIITIFGGLLIIAGFYAMSFGFATPPNILLFLLGLIMAVAGMFLVIIFSSGIDMSQMRTPSSPKTAPRPTPVMRARPKPIKVEKTVTKEEQKEKTLENIEKIKPQPRIKRPKKVERPDMSSKALKEEIETSKMSPEAKEIGIKEIKPKKKVDTKSATLPPDLTESSEIKKIGEPEKVEPVESKAEKIKPIVPKREEIKPIKEEKVEPIESKEEVEPIESKEEVEPIESKEEVEPIESKEPIKSEEPIESREKIEPVKVGEEEPTEPAEPVEKQKGLKSIIPRIKRPTPKQVKKAKPVEAEKKEIKPTPIIEKPSEDKPIVPPEDKPPVPKRPDLSKLKSAQTPGKEDEYVKKRLDKLKESYIQNAKDIESIIDERLDSFKGTLGKLKTESKEPGIIWSFDAGDVQEAMMDTISKANKRILMMYPWIRNIDVSILKKFMDTDSCMIVQEASLDDDASVELLKLLIDKDVKIRTMPHVHTIAIVADESNGLIISTDPIYESYEVGVIYKDQKSIEEIERLFEDAWSISQDIDLEIK